MNIRTVVAAIVATATAGALAWPSMAAASSTPGDNGPIAFTLELPHSEQLHALDPETGALRPLVRAAGVHALHADWSPSGRQIVFEADRKDRGLIQIVRSDGTHRHTLHPGLTGFLGQAAFVPHSTADFRARVMPV